MKIINVSYRLPISLQKENGKVHVSNTAGGLSSAILSYIEKANCELVWTGVANFEPNLWHEIKDKSRVGYELAPIFLGKQLDKHFYQGFSNAVIYPLFTYFPSFVEYKEEYLTAYKTANKLMAEKVISLYKKGDIIWIHDYHFIPLAGLLRKEIGDAKIMFFLHIPFPNYELIKLLPQETQQYLFTNLLAADIVGFHTWEYALHFIETSEKVLGVTQQGFSIYHKNRKVDVGVYPISIDFEKFYQAYDLPDTKITREEILSNYGFKKIIFSVDRLDYTKGVVYRLNAYEQFLEKYPKWQNKVVFILVIVPSREEISKYAERKTMIELAISRINGKLGNYNWTPIIFQYKSLSHSELIALYTACNLILISPVRDGMNLVAKEFVASRKDKQGVLLLSELTGASRELHDAIIFHPLDIHQIATSIEKGLTMEPMEQKTRMESMQKYLARNTVFNWATKIIDEIKGYENTNSIPLDWDKRIQVLHQFSKAKKRLFLLDYDGTLAPFNSNLDLAIPSKEIIAILKALINNPKNEIWIISGRDKIFLEKHFGNLGVNLVAEHGAEIKKGEWKTTILEEDGVWMNDIERIFQEYVELHNDTFIEKKRFGIAWHYRKLGEEKGICSSRELVSILKKYLYNKKLILMDGNKTIEVKHHLANKGDICKTHIIKEDIDFILAIGDAKTDEDMFALLTESHHITIKVGDSYSKANYQLDNTELVKSFLSQLSTAH